VRLAVNGSDALYQFILRINETIVNGTIPLSIPVSPDQSVSFDIPFNIDQDTLSQYLLLWQEIAPNVTSRLQSIGRCVSVFQSSDCPLLILAVIAD
jgi:hypothetical protein